MAVKCKVVGEKGAPVVYIACEEEREGGQGRVSVPAHWVEKHPLLRPRRLRLDSTHDSALPHTRPRHPPLPPPRSAPSTP